MKNVTPLLLLAGTVLSLVGTLAANEAPPPRPVAPPTKMTVPVVVKYADLKDAGEGVKAKLVLPAKLHPGLGGAKAGGKFGSYEHVAPTQRSIVAALALSLAAVSIVFVLRGKKLNTATKAAVLGIACMLGLFGAAQADIPVPGGRRPPRPVPPPVKPEVAAKSSLVIEFSDEVEEAVLTLPAK